MGFGTQHPEGFEAFHVRCVCLVAVAKAGILLNVLGND